MAYQIRKQNEYDYYVVDTKTNTIIGEGLDVDQANELSWLEKNPEKRYQILANCFSGKQELTWYSEENDILIANSYASIEEARLDIIGDLKALCFNNDYATHPNPEGDYSIIDTFNGEEVDYKISDEEARYPTEADFEKYNVEL